MYFAFIKLWRFEFFFSKILLLYYAIKHIILVMREWHFKVGKNISKLMFRLNDELICDLL